MGDRYGVDMKFYIDKVCGRLESFDNKAVRKFKEAMKVDDADEKGNIRHDSRMRSNAFSDRSSQKFLSQQTVRKFDDMDADCVHEPQKKAKLESENRNNRKKTSRPSQLIPKVEELNLILDKD